MSERRYCVYTHINKTNQKRYVGMTGLKPKVRWGNNGSGYKNQPDFFNDIQQYGWDGFEHVIIYSHLTKEEAQEKEIALIKMCRTYESEHGYNKNCRTLRDYKYYTPKVKEREKLIHCEELNLTFKTSVAAKEATGVDSSSIIKVCKGIRKSAGKHPDTNAPLHWHYIYIENK